jgi:hypothetical protein
MATSPPTTAEPPGTTKRRTPSGIRRFVASAGQLISYPRYPAAFTSSHLPKYVGTPPE